MKANITQFDEELVEKSRRFLDAADANPASLELLEKYGFVAAERERGRALVRDAARSFEWERTGNAWNFLSPTAERRIAEAQSWYRDRRRRHLRSCVAQAEREAGWTGDRPATRWPLRRKLAVAGVAAVRAAARALSPTVWRAHRAQLARDLARASGPRPADAPPPKDTVLVELSGWYERWHLLAQRLFRGRADLLAPFGLVPGKAPPRLRGREARLKYGERAGTSLPLVRDDGSPAQSSRDSASPELDGEADLTDAVGG